MNKLAKFMPEDRGLAGAATSMISGGTAKLVQDPSSLINSKD